MVAALANGFSKNPNFLLTLNECRQMSDQGYLIAGDRKRLTAEGFELGNSPIAYLK